MTVDGWEGKEEENQMGILKRGEGAKVCESKEVIFL